jgi:hypothetical protein
MKALLICPQERTDARFLSQSRPFAALSAFGRPLVVHWLEHVRSLGATHVKILASDRPEAIRTLVGNGSRWNLTVEVIAESAELTIEEARSRHCDADAKDYLAQPSDVSLVDHFPGLPEHPLFNNYASWFNGLRALLTRGGPAVEDGMQEMKPGVWISPRARVAANVQFHAPCWIGAHAIISGGATIGPMAVIEDRVIVESGVEIANSSVAPETFIGRMTELKTSMADGSILMNWRTASCTRVPDAFLMCSLGKRDPRAKSAGLVGRFAASLALVMFSPLALLCILWSKLRGRPGFRELLAVRPCRLREAADIEAFTYRELSSGGRWLSRWPQLWSILKGDFAWVGNRPLGPAEAVELTSDFDRLWLAAPVGMISLAQVEGAFDAIETRAWASLYALQANWRLDLSILARALFSPTRNPVTSPN